MNIIISLLIACFLFVSPAQKVNFAVIGDYGLAGIAEEQVMELVDSKDPDFVVTVGDNNYPRGEAATIETNIGKYYGKYLPDRFFPSLGNHDWEQPNAQPYIDYFELPGNERYYDVIKGPVHLFIIDSDLREPDGITSTSVQAQWLQQRLAQSTAKWQLVFFHHAPYSSGVHGNSAWMQWPFRDWGVDAVLTGHDHHYERLSVDGIPYFVNGSGGHSLRTIPNVVPQSVVRYNGDFGAMFIKALANKSLEFTFFNRQGTLIDRFTIN